MELPKRKQNRLSEYDYRTPNAYFITICAANRKCIFWNDPVPIFQKAEDIPLSFRGSIVRQCICDISKHYPMITVDCFTVMPNHIHLLLQIHRDTNGMSEKSGRPMAAPTVSQVINQLKGAASRQIGDSVWQKGFYDHVIRNEQDYLHIWKYIENNPFRWTEDDLYAPSP